MAQSAREVNVSTMMTAGDDPITSFIGITTSACYVVLVMHAQLSY